MRASNSYRVAMVAACPFPSLRGSQVLIRELAEGLAAAGHSVHVVTYPTAQHLVPVERIAIHRVAKLPGLWTARPFGWQKAALDFLLLLLLLRVVRRERIQVIHAHNLEAPLLAYAVRLLTGVPVVYHAHNALTDELPCYFCSRWARRLARHIGAFLDHRIARWADYSIALSDRLAAFLAVRGAAGRVATVPPGIGHVPSNGRPAARRDVGPLIMYAGNLDPYQNLGCLLEGFDRVCAAEPRARLVLVTHKGAHPQNRQRALLANRAGVAVRSVATFAAAARELRRADVLICPRTSWSGFPIKVLNYMALGRPVVQARGSAHVIEDGVNGLLFAENDPISLARAVLRVVRDPALALRLGCEAKNTVRGRFAWSQLLPRVQEVYESVVEDRHGGGGPGRRVAKPTEQTVKRTPKRVGSGEPLARSLSLVGPAG
jgi:glycosyltransferase involved in cell wall biosynthesis